MSKFRGQLWAGDAGLEIMRKYVLHKVTGLDQIARCAREGMRSEDQASILSHLEHGKIMAGK